MARHAFTVAEADALLPHVRGVFRRIEAYREAARRRVDRLAVLDVLWGERVREAGHPDHGELRAAHQGLTRIRHRLERLVESGLTERGLRLPGGGLEHGLIDFPTTLDGRWIYLCWQKDEPAVQHWHELRGGFVGRRPLTPDVRARLALPSDPARDDDRDLEG